MPFINMTPHPINIFVRNENGDEEEIRIDASGETIRLEETWSEIKIVGGVPITQCFYSTPTQLPSPVAGLYYIVSAMVANAFPLRSDFLIPAQTIRNNEGRIIGCTSLSLVNYYD